MSESNAFQPGGSGGSSAVAEAANASPLIEVDPVWLVVMLLCFVIIVTRSLTSANTLRERKITGGHYRGKVTPKWYARFQRTEAVREDEVERGELQDAIRARRR